MKRFLIVGDFHIPRRARRVPAELEAVARRGGFDAVLCTGDLVGKEVLEFLEELAPLVLVAAGNMDTLDFEPRLSFEAEGWRLGVAHGSEVYPRGDPGGLAELALVMDVDVLVNGHTHADAVSSETIRGRRVILVNPGSATGVECGGACSGVPSIAVLELEPEEARVEVWRLGPDGLSSSSARFGRT